MAISLGNDSLCDYEFLRNYSFSGSNSNARGKKAVEIIQQFRFGSRLFSTGIRKRMYFGRNCSGEGAYRLKSCRTAGFLGRIVRIAMLD